jgi:hypothetical protein
MLGRGIGGNPDTALEREQRRHIDDAAGTLIGDHMARRALAQQEQVA